jgi:hypothetical protein
LSLGAFRVRSYRFQWSADLLTSWASEMETIILAWYVLTSTGSVLLLTVFGSLQFLGTWSHRCSACWAIGWAREDAVRDARDLEGLASGMTGLAWPGPSARMGLALATLTGLVAPTT